MARKVTHRGFANAMISAFTEFLVWTGILLKTSSRAAISITDSGITISNGQGATIALEGGSVILNNVLLNLP